MGYANYVGRVGALAVALGIGGALANGSGIAMAAPEPDPAGVDSPAPGNDAPATQPTTPKPHPITGLGEIFSEVRHAFEGLPARQGRLHVPSSPPRQVDANGDGQTTGRITTRTVFSQHNSSHAPSLSPRREVAQRVDRAVNDVKDVLQRAPRPPASPADSGPSTSVQEPSVQNIAVADPPAARQRTLFEQPHAQSTIAAARPLPRLLSLFGLGHIPGGGDQPRENPLVAAVLGWVRRLDRTFDNRTPTTDFNSQQVVQVDADRAVGYLDPVDPDSSRLTYGYTTDKGGTVTFDPTTAGKFTYAAPDGRDENVEWTDTVSITTSDAQSGWHVHGLAGLLGSNGGHTTTQTVLIDLKPVDDPDVGDDGTVTGHVPADNSTLSYTSGGDLPNAVGTVELNDDGTWVFKPSAAARDAAANGGPQSVTFTIIARDGEHQTPISLTADITPTSGPPTTLPPGAESSGPPVTGADGSSVQASTVDNMTYLTITDATGGTHISQPLAGQPAGPAVSAAGNAYVATFDADAGKTYLNIVLPNGTVKSTEVEGQTDGTIVVGANGEAYITSVVSAPQTFSSRSSFARFAIQSMPIGPLDPDTGIDTTTITVLKPDGSTFTVTDVPGHESGDIVITDDGYAYQTTYQGHPGTYETYVTVIDAEAETWATTDAIAGEPRLQIVTKDGIVLQLAYAPEADLDGVPGADSSTDVTTVNQIARDGTVTTVGTLRGDSMTAVTLANGTGGVYIGKSTNSANESSLLTIGPDGDLYTADLPGSDVFRDVVFDGDGYAYLATYGNTDEFGNSVEQSYVTVIAPDGAIPDAANAVPLLGTPRSKGIFIGADGKPYITTSNGSTVKVNTIGQDGAFDERASLPGTAQDSALVAADGTIYQPTYEFSPDFTVTTFYGTVIEPDGTEHKILLHGNPPDSKIVMDPQGVFYQPTSEYATDQSYITVIHGDGTYQETVGIPGYYVQPLVVGPDGTVYYTSASFATHQTYVSVIAPDGTARISEPLNGPSGTGVMFDANGRPYQPLASGNVALNPSTWTVYASPGASRTQIALPAGAKPVTQAVSSGGKLYQTSYDQSSNQSYLTVVGADGVAHDSQVMPGKAIGAVQFGKGGLAYQITEESSGQAYVNAVNANGDVVTTTLRGQGGELVVGADGTAAASSIDGQGNDQATYLTVFDAMGTGHDVVYFAGTDDETDALPGSLSDSLIVGSDGTVYIATSKPDENGRFDTNYAVVAPDGTPVVVDQASGEQVIGVVVGSSGPAYMTTTQNGQTFVTVLGADGTNVRDPSIPTRGEVTGPVVLASDGTAYVSTWDRNGTRTFYDDDRARVYTISPTGTITEVANMDGIAIGTPVAGPNGEIYQSYTKYDATNVAFTSYVVVIDENGTQYISDPMPGVPEDNGLRIGQDGVAYQITRPAEAVQETVVYAVAPNGATHSLGLLSGQPLGTTRYVAPDGTSYLTTYTRVDVNNQTYYTTSVTVIGADGVPHAVSVPRAPEFTPGDQTIVVGSDGTLYQLTLDGGTRQNFVTTIRPDGAVHLGTPMPGEDPGYQALVRGPDDTVYLTSTVQGPGGVGGETYVAIVQTDGGVKFGTPLSGQALGGVVVGPGGKLYQTTTDGTYALDTSTWVVRHAPEDGGFTVLPVVGDDGTVTGSTVATDLDLDTLTYEFDSGDPGVTVLEDGTWTFTPTEEQRAGAYSGAGPTTVTFTVIATDGKYRTPVTVVAPIDPDVGAAIALPS